MDLTGKIFGDYKAIKEDGYDSGRHILWLVECTKCGTEKRVRRSDLLSGRKTICRTCFLKNKIKSIINKQSETTEDDFLNKYNIEDIHNIHEVNENLLNVPIYYSIAYPITKELRYNELDNFFNKYFNIDAQLEDYKNIEWNNGDIVDCSPILFFVCNGIQSVSVLKDAFISLKNYCINKNIHYLAIPQSIETKKSQDLVTACICNAFVNTDIVVTIMYGYEVDDIDRASHANLVEFNSEVSAPIRIAKE